MKKAFLIVFLFALVAFTAEKFVIVKFTEPEIQYHWQSMNQIKAIVDQSNLPHNQAVFVIKSIDSLQKSIQLNAKIDSTTLKPTKK